MRTILAILLLLLALMAGYMSGPYADLLWARLLASRTQETLTHSPQLIVQCIGLASTTYQVPPNVVAGVMYVEGGHTGQAVGPNVNGTYDLGLMQVNSLWVMQLAQLWRLDYHAAYKMLRDNDCTNIYVGTWILKQKIIETGSLYQGIAYYHSATPRLGKAYANKVIAVMRFIPPPSPQEAVSP